MHLTAFVAVQVSEPSELGVQFQRTEHSPGGWGPHRLRPSVNLKRSEGVCAATLGGKPRNGFERGKPGTSKSARAEWSASEQVIISLPTVAKRLTAAQFQRTGQSHRDALQSHRDALQSHRDALQSHRNAAQSPGGLSR